MWSTWAGAACVIAGVIWLIWFPKKHLALRCIGTGFALEFVARLMIWFSNNHEWLLVGIGLFGVIYLATHPVLVEKILMKFNIFWDINNDGRHGTKIISKPTSHPDPELLPSSVVADISDGPHTAANFDLDTTPVHNDISLSDDAGQTEPILPHTDTP